MKHARKDGLLPLHIAARTSSEHAAAVVSWLLTASLATHEVKYKEQARDRTLEELVAEGENSIARTEKKHHISFQTLTTAISGGSTLATSYVKDQLAKNKEDITVEEEEFQELLIRTASDAGT